MKKIIAVIITCMIFFSVIGANAASIPSFMEEIYRNYTADYTLSVRLENADELIGFLKEVEMPDEVYNYVDVKALIESLGSYDSAMDVQLEISPDFRRIKAALTSETTHNIYVNRNYSSTTHAGMGVWVEFDADKKLWRLIYSTPLNEKYAVIDIAKDFPEEISEQLFELYDKIMTPEFIGESHKTMLDLISEYAEITMNGTTCKVKIDNDGFLAIINNAVKNLTYTFADMQKILGEDSETPEIPELKNVKLLGDKGISITYKLYAGKIKSVSEEWDVSVNIPDIIALDSEEPWEYDFSGNINFSLKSEGTVKKHGTTKVNIPEITEENSFNLPETMEWFDDYYKTDEEDYEHRYVSYWTMGYKGIEADNNYYMPLRECMEDVYHEWVTITYDNGYVTVVTDCGIPESELNMAFRVGENKAVVNGKTYSDTGTFRNVNGTVYASRDFYEKCLNWRLIYLYKDILEGGIRYEYSTME